ncbi:MAG: transcription-repair coupling factor, partial [Flavobacteriaceae bacterium]|nr:transcription-repair coupling factor [Flavobacteriaceae bacterium]
MSKKILFQKFKQSLIHQKLSVLVSSSKQKIHLKGALGSSFSFSVSTVFNSSDRPFLLIFDSKEEAAYYLNDFEMLLDEKQVLFYPGSYRRPYHVEETDNANVLLRAEVLNRINSQKKPAIIITYPEALFEKVVSRTQLEKSIFKVSIGETLNLDFFN